MFFSDVMGHLQFVFWVFLVETPVLILRISSEVSLKEWIRPSARWAYDHCKMDLCGPFFKKAENKWVSLKWFPLGLQPLQYEWSYGPPTKNSGLWGHLASSKSIFAVSDPARLPHLL